MSRFSSEFDKIALIFFTNDEDNREKRGNTLI